MTHVLTHFFSVTVKTVVDNSDISVIYLLIKKYIKGLFNLFYVRTSGGNVVIKGISHVLCLFVRNSSCKTVGNFIVY